MLDQLINLACTSPRDFLDDDLFVNDGGLVVDPHSKKCFEYYYQIGHVFRPKTILEIGIRYGYSLLSLIRGSKRVRLAEGWDNEQYVKGSNAIAHLLLSQRVSRNCKLKFENKDSQKISELPRSYDLISIDGDHSFEGTYHDLCLTTDKCHVVTVDDYDYIGSVKKAVDLFIKRHGDLIEDWCYLPSYRGTIVIEYKSNMSKQ